MNLLQKTVINTVTRKIGPAGELFLRDQCKVINVELEDLVGADLSALADRCAVEAEPLIGNVQAKLMGGILNNLGEMAL